MRANKVLIVIISILSFFLLPIQLITTFLLGIVVHITFGIILFPLSIIWVVLSFPLICLSWLSSKVIWLRNIIGFLGIPWAIIVYTFTVLVPAMGELENRATKIMLAESFPFSWEFWQFQLDKLPIEAIKYGYFGEVIIRISKGDQLKQRTINKLINGDQLD